MALLALVILGLAPVTWIRSPRPVEPIDDRPILAIEPLGLETRVAGPFRVEGAWALDSPNHRFGSYSALVALGDGTLLAGSDKGTRVRFAPPGQPPLTPQFGTFAPTGSKDKWNADLESLTRDPASGTLWAGFEYANALVRFDAGLRLTGQVRPEAMRAWPGNAGPEAFVRLADGRFLVIAEAAGGLLQDSVPALLFPADPVAGSAPEMSVFRPPAGYRPVDVAQLPDGRLLILTRRVLWGLPPRFAGKLVLADPRTIRRGGSWGGQVVAELDDRLPSDNYEGLAIEPAADGAVTVWLISDDNDMRFQRTLLLRLWWRP